MSRNAHHRPDKAVQTPGRFPPAMVRRDPRNTEERKEKGAGGVLIDLEKERDFREYNPSLLLTGGQIFAPIPGHLRVGALLPFCAQTKHLVPSYFSADIIDFLPTPPISVHMLVRHDDALDPDKYGYFSETARREMAGEIQQTSRKKDLKKNGADKKDLKKNGAEEDALSEEDKQLQSEKDYNVRMIRNFECISAGARLYSWFDVFNCCDEEVGLLVAMLKKFSIEPYVGGRSATGYGRISAAYNLTLDGDPATREEKALLFNMDEGFVLNSPYLAECLDKATAWLKTLTPEKVSFFSES